MHDGGGGGFSGGGHDGGGFFGGGHDGGGGHHHHHQPDFRPHDLMSPTDPVYGKRYGRQADDYRSASARGRAAMWIVRLVVFAVVIFFIGQFFAAT